MDQAEVRARENQVSSQNFQLAKFAVTAFSDELVLNSDWEYRIEWKANTMQMLSFQTHTAGEEFFRKLKTLEPDQVDVIEIYYFCLCLGFMGEMVADKTRLMSIRHETMQRLDVRDKLSSGMLTPQAYETVLQGEKSQWNLPSYLWAIIPLAALFILYIVYYFLLNYQVVSTLEMIVQ